MKRDEAKLEAARLARESGVRMLVVETRNEHSNEIEFGYCAANAARLLHPLARIVERIEPNGSPPIEAMCGKRTARFLCTLAKDHGGAHGRRYRREAKPKAAVVVVRIELSAAEVETLKAVAKGRGEKFRDFVATEARVGITNVLYSDEAARVEGGAR